MSYVVVVISFTSHHLSDFSNLIVRASDMRLNGREFDPRSAHYRSVDRLLDG